MKISVISESTSGGPDQQHHPFPFQNKRIVGLAQQNKLTFILVNSSKVSGILSDLLFVGFLI